MTKTYITAISLQNEKDLQKPLYQPQGFELNNNLETSFPIIPIILEDADKIDDGKYLLRTDNIKVIALVTKNESVLMNFEKFKEELKQYGIQDEQIKPVFCEENQKWNTGINAMLDIINEIPEDAVVYVDITFGTKPMSVYLFYSSLFVEKIKDAEVVGIYYGEIKRDKDRKIISSKLYDMTILKELANLIDDMEDLGVDDIQGALQNLIKM